MSEESETADEGEQDLPADVQEEVERLERLARSVSDEAEAAAYRERRDELVAEYLFEARVREDENRDVLVCHPSEWLDDEGLVRTDRVEEVSRGVEIPLSGPGDPENWEAVESHNRALAESVAANHGDPHGTNAHALADFAGNHYAKPVEELTAAELDEFDEEYYTRNVWSDDEAAAVLSESIRYVFDAAETAPPEFD